MIHTRLHKKKILNLGCGHDKYGTHRIDFKETDATTQIHDLEKPLPFKDNYFDEVKFYNVFEHVKNCELIVNEIYRVLKKGGMLDLRTDNAGFLIFHVKSEHNSYLYVPGYNKHPEDFHRYLFVPSHLKAHLKVFSKIKVTYLLKGNFFKRLILKLLPRPLGYEQIRVRAIK